MTLPPHPVALEAVLEGLCGLNFAWMTEAGGAPPLYETGIVYRPEPPGQDHWQTAPELLKSRVGDCEDLTAYRVAELRFDGEPARGRVVPTRRGKFHAVVERASGEIEDPSRILIEMEKERR